MKSVENLAVVSEARPIGPDKDRMIVRTDDGDCYEWSRPLSGEPFVFERKTSADGRINTQKRRLPTAVRWWVTYITGDKNNWKY